MNNRKHDKARCNKITAIRAAAGNPGTHCPTCTRAITAGPFTRFGARGHVTEGCVDACHAGHHVHGEVARWFYRPEAQALRAAELARLVSL